jgi:hypothetical protein
MRSMYNAKHPRVRESIPKLFTITALRSFAPEGVART